MSEMIVSVAATAAVLIVTMLAVTMVYVAPGLTVGGSGRDRLDRLVTKLWMGGIVLCAALILWAVWR